ncbi:hypothetical protein COP1_029886 [Malus domestica]
MQVLRSMENISLETRREVRILYSLIKTLQRKLELEYSLPNEEFVNKGSSILDLERKPTTPSFPCSGKREDKGKKNKQTKTSQQRKVGNELHESSLLYLLPPQSGIKKPRGLDVIRLGMHDQEEGPGARSLPDDGGKPSPNRPPSLVNKE